VRDSQVTWLEDGRALITKVCPGLKFFILSLIADRNLLLTRFL